MAETRLEEDPEAEEAAAANAGDSDPATPTLKGAPDSSVSEAIEGMCCMVCLQVSACWCQTELLVLRLSWSEYQNIG